MKISMMNFSTTIMLFLLILELTTLCSGTASSSGKPSNNKPVSMCYGGQPGTNGIPGTPGIPGSPGEPGFDGRDGVQGPAGQKGQRGEKGESRNPGTPQLSSHMNWKECTWKQEDGKDSGVIQNCEFMKNFTHTSLHVYFAGNLRIRGCDGCCRRWYFTFNGAECSSPGPIEDAFYMRTGKNHDLHRHRHIEGHCKNIHKGKVRVGFWVGSCNNDIKNTDAHTGLAIMSRIFIEEVPKAQQ